MAGKLNTLVEPNLDGVGANSVGAVQTPDAIVNESGREGVLRDNREHSQPTRPECSREHGSQRLWLRTRSGGRDLVEELSRCGVNSAASFDPCCEKPQARTVREFWVRPGLRFAAALQGHADSGLCVREGAAIRMERRHHGGIHCDGDTMCHWQPRCYQLYFTIVAGVNADAGIS